MLTTPTKRAFAVCIVVAELVAILGLSTIWIPWNFDLIGAAPFVLASLAALASVACVWFWPFDPWTLVPVGSAVGVCLGIGGLIAIVHLAWPGQVKGCYVHTFASGGYDDWVCFGPIPLVTEGAPALIRAGWEALVTLPTTVATVLLVRPLARYNARFRTRGPGAMTAT